MGYTTTSPAPEKCDPTAKNRVRGFFGEAQETSRQNRPQPQQPRRENRPTTTRTASGRTYWPSRDPIGEAGGLNLYGMVGNDAVGRWDYLGLTVILPYEGGAPIVNTPPMDGGFKPGWHPDEWPDGFTEDQLPSRSDDRSAELPILWGEEISEDDFPEDEEFQDNSYRSDSKLREVDKCYCEQIYEKSSLQRPPGEDGVHPIPGRANAKCTPGAVKFYKYPGKCVKYGSDGGKDCCSDKKCGMYIKWICVAPNKRRPQRTSWKDDGGIRYTKCK